MSASNERPILLHPEALFSFREGELTVHRGVTEPRLPSLFSTRNGALIEVLVRLARGASLDEVESDYDDEGRGALRMVARRLANAGLLVDPQSSRERRDVPPDIAQNSPEFVPIFRAAQSLLMSHNVAKCYALYSAVRHVVDQRIPGAVVECGVFRGGSAVLAARTLLAAGETERPLYLYDAFDASWPDPDPVDGSVDGLTAEDKATIAKASRAEAARADASALPHRVGLGMEAVRREVLATGYPEARVTLVPGYVEDTIPGVAPERIALLRLDTDFYRSTRHELEHLYPRLAPGGVLLVDDYPSEHGAKAAVDEYFASLARRPLLQRIGASGRMAVKPG